MDREWELKSACRNVDPEVFFADRSRGRAKAICEGCLVIEQCLAATLVREAHVPKSFRTGIVAALTGAQRWELDQKQQGREVSKKIAVPKAATPGPVAPCGTRAAYQRHLRNGEPIDDKCRDANSASKRHWTATGTTQVGISQPAPSRPLTPCGSYAAYRRHIRKGEPVDAACRAANTARSARYRAASSTQLSVAG
ncbi:WhiB family transcriptional regulator [Streptomyces sp. NPDC093223]|uniref:WhiB family transcriptional regulator n=1 Tax=Streptomyces sp. NPDC093223 TaxID=3366033 RepID=UPI003823BCE3